VSLLVLGSFGTTAILWKVAADVKYYSALLTCSVTLLSAILFLKKPAHQTLYAIMGLSAFSMFLSLIIPQDEIGIISATLFVLYWLGIAFVTFRMNYPKLFRLAVWVIAIRLFIAYLEVFGTLAVTGVGLIGTGIIFLGTAYLTRKIQNNFEFKGDAV
jgi:hypothetical protein